MPLPKPPHARRKRNKTEKVDEIKVQPTDQTVRVRPPRRRRTPDHPTAPAAVDRRRQVVGTDEPRRGRG